MRNDDENLIIFFVRSPIEGKVKTRLSKSIGEKTALELYKRFVCDILVSLESIKIPFMIFFTTDFSEERIADWLGRSNMYHPQEGNDLGDRMRNGFSTAFSGGFRNVILIGSDSPDLPPDHIIESFVSLRSNDVVIGPAKDGGYYLVGFRSDTFAPYIFEGKEWSGGREFRDTMDQLEMKGARVHVLPEWYDIDTYVDLKMLYENNADTSFSGSNTMKYINTNTDLFK